MWLGYLLAELNNFKYPEIEIVMEISPLTIEDKIRQTFPERAELMLAIANCESGLNQEAVSHTRDFGVMQINEATWHETALEMNLDYKGSVDDNLELARHIYETQGLEAWVCYTDYIYPQLALAE